MKRKLKDLLLPRKVFYFLAKKSLSLLSLSLTFWRKKKSETADTFGEKFVRNVQPHENHPRANEILFSLERMRSLSFFVSKLIFEKFYSHNNKWLNNLEFSLCETFFLLAKKQIPIERMGSIFFSLMQKENPTPKINESTLFTLLMNIIGKEFEKNAIMRHKGETISSSRGWFTFWREIFSEKKVLQHAERKPEARNKQKHII